MADDFPQTPEGIADRSDKFLKVAEKTGNAGIFNVPADDLTTLRTETDATKDLVEQRDDLEAQVKGINATLKMKGGVLGPLLRDALKKAAASSAPEDDKSEAGVTIPKPRVKSAPKVPTDLLATPNAAGYVDLKWNRNENGASTKFVVEKRTNGAWVLVDILTATSLRVPVPIGEKTALQVKARNGQGTSEPSNIAVVYDD